MEYLVAPAHYAFFGVVPGWLLSLLYLVAGLAIFAWVMWKRLAPLLAAKPDPTRLRDLPARARNVVSVWLCQVRQPRYLVAGLLHIVIFFGFLILAIRTCSLTVVGIFPDFALPGFAPDHAVGAAYNVVKDYTATAVFVACAIAAVRRGIVRPARYAVPPQYGHDHTAEAVFVLAIIMGLMLTESLFEGVLVSAGEPAFLAPATLAWCFAKAFASAPKGVLQYLHLGAYYAHETLFFFFLNFLPMGKHFHVITSFFNVLFMRVTRGNVKPVAYGVTAQGLDELPSLGVKKLEDFTWKHMLDFYSCADCGRCSDQCPANLVGRPLSPRFISIKGRDLMFRNYPVTKAAAASGEALVGSVYNADEIWSCTTCGACERECPIGIEYIDKIVDLRRGLVDDGEVPQTLQKPLQAIGKRGNPWGKMEKKRADWTRDAAFFGEREVKTMEDGETGELLYFVDSITSYDDRMVEIAKCSARILDACGEDFFVIGKDEKDSGNEVLRFGEEMLYQDLQRHNTETIKESGAKRIVASDPHAYNALKNDYAELDLPVEHISQVIARHIRSGKIKLKPVEDPGKVYTYHDPCYLGRHNDLYDDPRAAIEAIPGIRTVEMAKKRDRSLCCSGGGLMLFHEPHEKERMAVIRVKMAAEAGANVIVCACPFCMVNMEDAIKVAGLDGQLEAIELTELVSRHLQ
uniref:(Fe-S)-binding protein n=1 Tax=Geomonas azotofigens TaxID=2843196 RepID=UPI0038B37866